ncbi:MAG: hypothetical protein SO015_02735 [Wujia sp.]|nr:hypothetical protein [Wujia sp.]MDY3727054.1 hypothetical protein [Wujia sp.]
MWKLEFEAVDESRLPFFVGLSGKLEQSVRKPEDYSKWNGKGSKRVGVRSRKTGRLLQEEEKGKQAGWSKVLENGKIAPRGREREASRLEKKRD